MKSQTSGNREQFSESTTALRRQILHLMSSRSAWSEHAVSFKCELRSMAARSSSHQLRASQHNHVRPHHALGMRPPVPETLLEKSPQGGTSPKGLDKADA